MGNCCGSPATVPSSEPRPAQEAQPPLPIRPAPIPPSEPSRTTSVSSRRGSIKRHTSGTAQLEGDRPPRNSGVGTSERARSQTLQTSRRQEVNLQQYPSGGTDSSQRHRTKSMNAPQRQRSHSSGPRPRTASASASASASQAVSASSSEGRPRFPPSLQSLLINEFRYVVRRCPISYNNYGTIVHRFRILVVGRVRVI